MKIDIIDTDEIKIFILACIFGVIIDTVYKTSRIKLAHPKWTEVWK